MTPVTIRAAAPGDAARLLDLRTASIHQLASRELPVEHVLAWAARVTSADMERRIRDKDVWVAEAPEGPGANTIAGWMAIDGDRLEGLYVDPRFERQGIGTQLLEVAENLVRRRGGAVLRAEASRNAEGFYFRRGYVPEGPSLPHGEQPVVKRLGRGFESPH